MQVDKILHDKVGPNAIILVLVPSKASTHGGRAENPFLTRWNKSSNRSGVYQHYFQEG
jgi:hypothetical protein